MDRMNQSLDQFWCRRARGGNHFSPLSLSFFLHRHPASVRVFGDGDTNVPMSLTHTVVAEAAVGGTWRPEDLAGEAVLQLDCLAVDEHLLGPGRRPVAGGAISHVFGRTEEKRSIRNQEKKALKGRFFFSLSLSTLQTVVALMTSVYQ